MSQITDWATEIELYANVVAVVIQKATEEPVGDSYAVVVGLEATPLAAGRLRLLATGDLLLGIGAVLRKSPVPRLAPYALLRSALEAVAVAAWLWEPGISASDREHRGACARGNNLSEVFKLTGARVTEQAWDALGRVKLPGAIPILQQLLPTLDARGTSQGERLYRSLSGRSHGEMWATIAGEVIGPADNHSSWVRLSFDPNQFRDDAVQVLALVDRAVQGYGLLTGASTEAWFSTPRPHLA